MKEPIERFELTCAPIWKRSGRTPWLAWVDRTRNARPYERISIHSVNRVMRAMLKLAEVSDD